MQLKPVYCEMDTLPIYSTIGSGDETVIGQATEPHVDTDGGRYDACKEKVDESCNAAKNVIHFEQNFKT